LGISPTLPTSLKLGEKRWKRLQKKRERWKAPDEGVLKINTDASFLKTAMAGSTGFIVRDHQGRMIRGQALWYDHAANALIMEAMAILDGARHAMERNYDRVIIESDSQMAVNLCNANDQNRSELMPICQEISEIKRAFTSFSILFVGRDANKAAHLCAKRASFDRRRCLWINYNPDFLVDTLRSDCNPVD
jgi:ribonuclease HI